MRFERFSDLRVQSLPRAAQQAAMRCVLHQRVLEAVDCLRWCPALKYQLGGNKAI